MTGLGFMDALLIEAGRLFGVQASELFKRSSDDLGAEYAIGYVAWVLHLQQALSRYTGVHEVMPLVTLCARKRNADAKYDRLVGDLLWFAMSGMRSAAA